MQGRDVAITVAVVVLIILLLGLLAGGGMMGAGMMGYGAYFFSPLWGILTLVLWILVIVGIVLLVAWLLRRRPATARGPDTGSTNALDLLRERYARGEITREEYEQMRRDLEE